MNKDQLIADQALELAQLRQRVASLENANDLLREKWEKVTKALDLSEFSAIYTVTDRILSWKSSAEQWYKSKDMQTI